tara:strand:- start:496 stop:1533 length:1038 start_codon:yes stop_codon:yes gene_type:complete
MAFTTINKSTDYFNTLTYTGDDGTNRSITGVGFQPDFIWFKDRSNAFNHYLFDIIRDGQTYYISSNTNAGEATDTTSLKSMDSDGFTVGASAGVNGNNNNYVAWNWKANGTGAANTAGSINSTVSVNTTAGFSVLKYTGTGSAATVGHGLGVKPDMIFSKPYSSTGDWNIYHDSFSSQQRIKLNSTGAVSTNSGIFSSLPTSTLVNIGTSGDINANGTSHLFYCFNSVQGYSKFGSYTGNGNADGSFISTGFSPAFVMIKQTTGTGKWVMKDNRRTGINVNQSTIYASESEAEGTPGYELIDLLSNGFKQRGTGSYVNGSGQSYIYMAFAEAPLVGSNNVPANAR